jgi:2-polyprenyl-3-methyl-5-hydroxy-6-metoxy-1,4-benzoquinol methylase
MAAQSSIFDRQPETYSEHPDLLKWVKADPHGPLGRILDIIDSGEVLDIGSGAGILSRLFVEKSAVIIDGLDPAISPQHPGVREYRRFDQLFIEDILHEERISRYDWFVLADVIEHLPYPDRTLKSLVEKSSQQAKFIISTPNVAHLSVRLGLLSGDFDYTKSGILESTHLRFLTHSTLGAVLKASGLCIDRLICLNRPHYPDALDLMSPIKALASLFATGRDGFPMTYQFLAVCTRSTESKATRIEVLGDARLRSTLRTYASRRYGRWLRLAGFGS